MAQNNGIGMKLPSVDELFSSEETRRDDARERVMEIPASEISDFPDHPFKVKLDESMQHLAQSVQKYGILHPVLVRPKEEGGYEMVAGHRRKKACEIAGIEMIPSIVREMSRDEAIIAMCDSNLQRETVLPSEKAFAYKMKLEAIKRVAGRPKNNSGQVDPHFETKRSNAIIADEHNESVKQVQRYIRLTELTPDILQMVDDKTIAFNPAVELSYLEPPLQEELLDAMEANECTPSLSQAQRLKKAAQEGKLDRNGIDLVLSEEKPQQNNLTLKSEKLRKYFPKDATPLDMERHIFTALDFYDRHLQRKKQQEAR